MDKDTMKALEALCFVGDEFVTPQTELNTQQPGVCLIGEDVLSKYGLIDETEINWVALEQLKAKV